MKSIKRIVVYPYPIELVWKAISSREALSEWLMETDFKAVVGAEFTFTTDPAPGFDGVVQGKVLAVDPPHKLKYSWRGGPNIETEVSFQLEAVERGTRLTFEHSGFRGPRAVIPRFVLGFGWSNLFRKALPSWLFSKARSPES